MSHVVFDGFIKVTLLDTRLGERVVVEATDSVNVMVYIKDKNQLLLTRAPRISMRSESNPEGVTTETIAGRFDVNLSPKALMVKEAKEEAGVTITENDIMLLNSGEPMSLSAGILTEKAYLGYVEIVSSQMESEERIFGSDGEGEEITRIYLTADGSLADVVCDDVRVFAFLQYFMRIKGII